MLSFFTVFISFNHLLLWCGHWELVEVLSGYPAQLLISSEIVVINATFYHLYSPFLVAEGMLYGCKAIVCPFWFEGIIFLKNSFLRDCLENTIILFKKAELLANKVCFHDREGPETTQQTSLDIFFEQKLTLCISDNKSLNLHRFRLFLWQFDGVFVIGSIEIGCTEKANRAFVGSWIFS